MLLFFYRECRSLKDCTFCVVKTKMQQNHRQNGKAYQLLEFVSATFLARLHEVHRAIAVNPVVHVPVRVTLALKFSRSPYLDNHSSESIHT